MLHIEQIKRLNDNLTKGLMSNNNTDGEPLTN